MLFLIIFSLLIAYVFGSMYMKARTLPPGPIPVPLLGNVFQLGWGIYTGKGILGTMKEWKEKYGPVHTFWLGPMATVNICDWSIAHETMVKKGALFADRANPFFMKITRRGLGIIGSNGQYWTEQRRFALHSLRNFGLGRDKMEERCVMEIDYMCDKLNKDIEANGCSLTFDPRQMVDITVGNVINRMLFTERFTEEREKKYFELKAKMDEMIENGNILDMAMNDYTIKIPYFRARGEKFMKPQNDIVAFFREQIAQKRAAIEAGEHELKEDGEDFVDAFLFKMAKSKEEGVEDSFTDETLDLTLFDIWAAGQETTAATIYWAFAYLLLNDEVMESLMEELLSVTGGNRPIVLTDKPETPYLNAVITETLRVSSIVTLNFWRDTKEDTQVGDYVLPKGTAVTAQISTILADEKTFPQPEKFDPSRYLGDSKVDPQQVIAFGLGKRACLGESLARAEMYLVISNFLLRYKMRSCPDFLPSLLPLTDKGALRKAKAYKITIEKRFE